MKKRSLIMNLSDQPPCLLQASAMLVALLLLAGCSGGGSEGSGQEDLLPSDDGTGSEVLAGAEVELTRLQGSWQTACLFTGGMLPYQRLIFNVTDAVFTFDVGHFVDVRCNDAAQETLSFGTLSDPSSPSANDESGISLNVNQVTVTPLLSQVADSFNAISFCGFAGWVPEVSFDVSGCTDSGGLVAPRTESAVFLIDDGAMPDDPMDDVLFLGDIPGGEASVLNREVAYERVQ